MTSFGGCAGGGGGGAGSSPSLLSHILPCISRVDAELLTKNGTLDYQMVGFLKLLVSWRRGASKK